MCFLTPLLIPFSFPWRVLTDQCHHSVLAQISTTVTEHLHELHRWENCAHRARLHHCTMKALQELGMKHKHLVKKREQHTHRHINRHIIKLTVIFQMLCIHHDAMQLHFFSKSLTEVL